MGAIIGAATKAIITTMGNLATSWKLTFAFGLTTVLGVVIYNVVVDIMEEILTYGNAVLASVSVGELPNVVLQLTGLGAWVAQQTYLDQQIGIAVTAVSMKWVLCKIPFVKW